MKTSITALCVVLLLLATSAGFNAQDAGGKTVEQRLKELEDRVKVLEDKLAAAEREAALRETELAFGTMRDCTRIAYSKTGTSPSTLTGKANDGGSDVSAEDVDGEYVKFHDKVYSAKANRRSTRAALVGEEKSGDKRFGIILFQWNTGGGEVVWHKNLDELKKANADVRFSDTDVEAGDVDAYALYKKKGTMWMIKNVTKIQGMDDMVSYSKNEILEVTKTEAKVKMWMYDKDKKPMAGMEGGTEYAVKFQQSDSWEDPDAPPVETWIETIKVEAGEFECIVYEVSGGKTWTSKKHPGLPVKMEFESYSGELVEFKEGE